jgi:peptidoglycan hydrolase-like protein with peptidoglycan-binding domain
MRRGSIVGIGLVTVMALFVFSGCATTALKKSETDIQTLKGQVTDLESKVQQKDAEIEGLRQALSKTTEEKYNQMKESAATVLVPTPLQIQKSLKNAGFDPGEIDGKLGRQARKAIRDFQKANGLTADGKVGPKTWNELLKYADKAEAVSENVPAVAKSAPVVNEKAPAVQAVPSVTTAAPVVTTEAPATDK